MSEVPDRNGAGDITRLFPLVLAGDRDAQNELFLLIESEARKLAVRWLRRYNSGDHVGITELIGAAFIRLVPPPKSDVPRPEAWPHRGRFFALLCRNIWQVLFDMLRGRGFTNSKVLPELLCEALQRNDAILNALTSTGGQPEKLAGVLADMIWDDRTARHILAEGGDPSAVQRAVNDLLARADTRRVLHDAGGNPERLRDVIVDMLRSEAARKKLVVYRSILQEGSAQDSCEDVPAAGLAGIPEPQHGLTWNSLITLHGALDDLDMEFAEEPGAEVPGASDRGPRRSVHAQIIDLRLIGDYKWREIAEFLQLPMGTVYSRAKVAIAFLRDRLSASFSGIIDELNPPKA